MKPLNESVKPRIFVDSIDALERTFHELIPLSRTIGVKVEDYHGDSLVVSAPLTPNVNHQHSAFGGSMFAVAALAGWGLMQLKLSELLLDCNTVVQGGDVSFLRPVYDDLVCTVKLPADADAVFEALIADGVATTTVECIFESKDKPAMVFNATYNLKQRSLSGS